MKKEDDSLTMQMPRTQSTSFEALVEMNSVLLQNGSSKLQGR